MADAGELIKQLLTEVHKQNESDIEKKVNTLVEIVATQHKEMADRNKDLLETYTRETQKVVDATQANTRVTKELAESLIDPLNNIPQPKDNTDNLRAIEQAIKDKKMTVSTTTVSTKALEESLENLKDVVKGIKIPEVTFPKSAKDPVAVRISDGDKFIENFTKAANQVLMTGGGGGRTPTIELTGGIEAVPVVSMDSSGEVDSSPLVVLIDESTLGTMYVGEAEDPGTSQSDSLWRIKKIVESGGISTMTYADGDSNYNNIWNNRGSLSYS